MAQLAVADDGKLVSSRLPFDTNTFAVPMPPR